MSNHDRSFEIEHWDAIKKYQKYKDLDPFPDIAPALLNSADIVDYVRYTGMISPFYNDSVNLKPATYAINLKGKVVYWNKEHKKVVIELNDGDSFMLESNSIAFVTLEPFFQIPNYIATRFNLKIEHVYKGLLLGTGPIIDPGFCGRLSLPLHNLTNNDYEFSCGQQLIWMEFTKLSGNARWIDSTKNNYSDRKGKYYVYNKPYRSNKDVEYYLKDAYPGAIDSSIPNAINESKKSLKRVNKQVRSFNYGILITIISFVFGITSLIVYFTREMRYNKTVLIEKINENDRLINKLFSNKKQDSLRIIKLEEAILEIENAN